MVTRPAVPGDERDRGQLILVGAIAIAIILFGLVLIVNTATFTEVVGTEGTVESVKESSTADREIATAVGATVHEANVDGTWGDTQADDVENEAIDGLQEANASLRRSSLGTRGAYTNVSSMSYSQTGTRIVQRNGDFTRADDTTGVTWDPVEATDGNFRSNGAKVGFFRIVIDTESTDDGAQFRITVQSDGPDRTLDIENDQNANTVDLNGGGPGPCGDIEADQNDEVVLYLREGYTPNENRCTFDLVRPNEDQVVEFSGDLTQFQGDYDAVVDVDISESLADLDQYGNYDDASSQPYLSRALWAVEVQTEYRIDEVNATSTTREVMIYG